VNSNRFGVNGKLLRVDLTQKKTWVEDIPSYFVERGLGGKALGLKFLSQEKLAEDNPLSPSNKIILSTGLLTGTGAPTGAWLSLLTRSPLTGLLTASYAGGEFPVRLKMAGYDAIIIEGKAETPLSLVIGDKIQFLPSTSLWNKTVWETDEYFTTRWGRKMKVLCIGPAGERQYKTATAVMDRSRNGISPGLGAVMGSKNLKAIAAYGEKSFPLADLAAFKGISANILERISGKSAIFRELSSYGTANFLQLFNQNKVLPTRNFSDGIFEEVGKIDGEATYDSLHPKRIACFSCPIGCRRLSQMQGNFVEGPDLLDLVSFGSLCGNDDLQSILEARHRCNGLGIDPLSMGVTIASAMDLYEKGSISKREVGVSLNFGDSQAIRYLINQVEKDEGLGKLLAEDPLQVAKNHSFPTSVFHVRNQPVGPSHPLYDIHMELHYRVSNSGTWYLLAASPFTKKLEIYDQFNPRDDVSRVRLFQDMMAVMESLGFCEYLLLFLNLEDISSIISPILGVNLEPQALIQLGEKVSDVERQLNLEMDRDHKLLSTSPSWSSEAKNEKVLKYFSMRDWDERGVPKNRLEL
jgi:aldehyde:ferredoxin oxidoreductase